jgi:hypothetical protein
MTTYNPFDNPEFRAEFNATLDAKLNPLKDKVEEHETTINKGKGIAWLFGGLGLLIEPIFHFMFSRK